MNRKLIDMLLFKILYECVSIVHLVIIVMTMHQLPPVTGHFSCCVKMAVNHCIDVLSSERLPYGGNVASMAKEAVCVHA